AEEALEILRRRAERLDLVALAIEVDATIIVRRDVDVEDEHALAEIGVERLRDVWPEVRVAAIRRFDRPVAEHALDERVRVRRAVGNQKRLGREKGGVAEQKQRSEPPRPADIRMRHDDLPSGSQTDPQMDSNRMRKQDAQTGCANRIRKQDSQTGFANRSRWW